MAAAPEDVDAFHHHALVQADGLEARRFANHRRAPERSPGRGQCLGAGHGAFLIASRQDQQRLLERLGQQRLHRFDDQGEEALHVATAQAHPTAIDLGEFERVGLPQAAVEWHRVTVPGQYQAAGATAEACEQVELARRHLLDIAGKAQFAQPGGQQVDDLAVGLIQARLGTTDRRRRNQGSELVFHGWQWHAHSPGAKLIIEPSGTENKPPARESCTLHDLIVIPLRRSPSSELGFSSHAKRNRNKTARQP
ncbi:hypothetical protein D3C80_755870 [compost metagenome]